MKKSSIPVLLLSILFANILYSLPDRMMFDFQDKKKDKGLTVISGKGNNRLLQMEAGPHAGTLVRLKAEGKSRDLSDYLYVTLDIINRGTEEAFLKIRVLSPHNLSKNSWYKPNTSHFAWVKPGETRKFNCPLIRWTKYSKKPSYLDGFPVLRGYPDGQMYL